MANFITRQLTRLALRSPEVQESIKQTVSAEIRSSKDQVLDKARKQALEEFKKSYSARPRQYLTTNDKEIKGSEEDAAKNHETLYRIFSETPGAAQSASRISEALVGQGYIIKPIQGKTHKKKDKERLIELLDRPNRDETFEDLIKAGLRNYMMYGDFFLETVPNKAGDDVAALYNLNTAKMKILVDPKKKERGILDKVGYVRESQGKNIAYNLDNIIQISAPNPKGGLYGRAVLEDHQTVLTLMLKALTYNVHILKNNGRTPIKIELPDDATQKDAENVSAFYEKNFMGTSHVGKALVLYKGAKASALGISPADMSYLELLQFGMGLVAGLFGVPQILLGFPEGTNRATANEVRRAFYYSVVYPLRKSITQRLTQKLVVERMGIDGWQIDFRNVGVEESESSRRDTISAYSKGLMTPNQAMTKLGMFPSDENWAEDYYLLGSKNDTLIPVEDAIGNQQDESAPEATRPENEGGHSQQGEGADNKEE